MKPIEGYDLISEAGELKQLTACAVACKIIEVVEVADSDYLDFYFDIAEGEFKGYFAALQANTGKNYGHIIRSYKEKALPFFKAAMTAIEKSNPGYKWDWNEKGLSGKYCAIVFRDEEYLKDGEVKVMAKPYEIRSLQALRAGEIKIPPLKKLETAAPVEAAPVVSLDNSDLPF